MRMGMGSTKPEVEPDHHHHHHQTYGMGMDIEGRKGTRKGRTKGWNWKEMKSAVDGWAE